MSIDLPFWYNVNREKDTRKEPMLVDIILYLLQLIQQLYQQNIWLINFICKYIPLKQWAFDDAHSPKYQKFKVDELPIIEEPLPKLNWICTTLRRSTRKILMKTTARINISSTTSTASS